MTRQYRATLLGLLAVTTLVIAPAFADPICDRLAPIKQRRDSALQSINAIVLAAKGKQIDPMVFCARAAPLGPADRDMLDWLTKNKEWCQVPDDVIAQFGETRKKDADMTTRACSVAAKLKVMKEQAAKAAQNNAASGGVGGAPAEQSLPAGPL